MRGQPKTRLYGHDKTIHRTTLLNVEVDGKTGEVVSVWFRCMALPFDVTKVAKSRADDMRQMYATDDKVALVAVEVEDL